MRPSTFPVLISAPFWSKRTTSSLSPAAHAAKNTQSAENLILRATWRGWAGSRFVSDCSQRLSCSALLNRAELERLSTDIARNTHDRTREPYNHFARSLLLFLLSTSRSLFSAFLDLHFAEATSLFSSLCVIRHAETAVFRFVPPYTTLLTDRVFFVKNYFTLKFVRPDGLRRERSVAFTRLGYRAARFACSLLFLAVPYPCELCRNQRTTCNVTNVTRSYVSSNLLQFLYRMNLPIILYKLYNRDWIILFEMRIKNYDLK